MQSVPRVVFLVVLLPLSAAVSTYSQTQAKQQLAETAADKIIHRFCKRFPYLRLTINEHVRNNWLGDN